MRWPSRFFVTGTDTDVGKTLVSKVLVRGLQADYWKPIQAGIEPSTDSLTITDFINPSASKIWPERYVLKTPASPHLAAEIDGVSISLSDFELPDSTNKHLIVEGAGGLLVPMNENDYVIDLIAKFDLPALVVARSGLGTLNHTLLSIEALRRRNISIFGVILNGDPHESNKKTIEQMGSVKVLGTIPRLKSISNTVLDDVFESLIDKNAEK